MIITLVVRSKSNPAYRQRIFERLGFVSNDNKAGGIIVHAASVGEVVAIKPFIEHLLTKHPTLVITVTTFTPTGSAQVKKQFANRVQHCYLPLDVWPCSLLFLARLRPQALVLMETELWPNLIAQARSKHCKLMLINGRLSEKSFPRYQKLSGLISPCLTTFDQIFAQSDDNLERLRAIGAPASISKTSGNLKYDLADSPAIQSKAEHLSQWLPSYRPIWLIASTHEGDEQLALAAFKKVLIEHETALLIIVPRHPERFDKVYNLAQTSGFRAQKRSDESTVQPSTNIWVLDSLGELMSAYKLVDLVTIGGSFSAIGGHNPLEPALYRKPIITGTNMSNFVEIQHQLLQAEGIVELKHGAQVESELALQVSSLLANKERCQQLGDNAHNVVMHNQGATEVSVQALLKLLS